MHKKTILDNGLRVVSTTMPHTHSVSVSYLIGTGSRYETDEEAGISHFIEHLLFKGNTRRPTSKDISAAIEGVGGGLNGGTDRESTVYWARVARPNFSLALEVLTDMILDSLFDPQELERERSVIIEEINMTKDIPAQQVHVLTDELLWPEHPLGRDIAGSKETMTGITREMMLDYMESMYSPENTVIAIAGNIEHEEAVEVLNNATAGWIGKKDKPGFVPFSTKPNPRIRIEKKDTEQAHLCLALPGLPVLSDIVMCKILSIHTDIYSRGEGLDIREGAAQIEKPVGATECKGYQCTGQYYRLVLYPLSQILCCFGHCVGSMGDNNFILFRVLAFDIDHFPV